MGGAPRTARARSPRILPLAAKLQVRARATPQDLFQLAMGKWATGERFDLGRMAQELGVSRATVFRWCGSRELLYGEILSALFKAALEMAREQAVGTGPGYIRDVTHLLLSALTEDTSLRTFLKQDAAYAMGILMSRSSQVERRSAELVRDDLEAQAREGHIRPAMKLDDLAYLIVRIGESFLYRDAITGDAPDIESAVTAIHILVAAEKTPPGGARNGRRSR